MKNQSRRDSVRLGKKPFLQPILSLTGVEIGISVYRNFHQHLDARR